MSGRCISCYVHSTPFFFGCCRTVAKFILVTFLCRLNRALEEIDKYKQLVAKEKSRSSQSSVVRDKDTQR